MKTIMSHFKFSLMHLIFRNKERRMVKHEYLRTKLQNLRNMVFVTYNPEALY